MRGDDRSSRYPPRGVWFGLILAVGDRARVDWPRTMPEDDDLAPTRRPRRPGRESRDPVESARRRSGCGSRATRRFSTASKASGAGRPSSGSSTSRPAARRSRRSRSTPRARSASPETTTRPGRRIAACSGQPRSSSSVMIPPARKRRRSLPGTWRSSAVRVSWHRNRPRAEPNGRERRAGAGTRAWREPRPCPGFGRRAPLAPGRSWRRKRSRRFPQSPPEAGQPAGHRRRRSIAGGTAPKRDPMVQRAQYASNPAPGAATPGAATPDGRPAGSAGQSAASPGWWGTAAGYRLAADRRRAGGPGPEPHAQSRRPAAEHPASARARRVDRRSRAAADGARRGRGRWRQVRPCRLPSCRSCPEAFATTSLFPRSGRQLADRATANHA